MAVGFSNTNKPINPRGNDQSPKGYNRAALYSGKALDFDGVNDVIEFDGYTTFTGDFSLSMYIKTSTIAQKGLLCDSANNDGLLLYTADKELAIRIDGINHIWNTGLPIYNDYMNHLVVVRSGAEVTPYLNGVAGNSVTATSGTFAFNQFGRQTTSANYFYGQAANIKAFNVALTAAQVADLYNNPEKIVPTGVEDTALKLWLPMMEGAGTTAINGAPDALGDELFTQPIDLTSDFSNNSGGVIVDADTFTSAGGTLDGIIANVLSSGKTYVIQIEGSTTSSGFTLGAGNASGNEYGTGFGVHYFKATHHQLWIRQQTAGTTDLTTLTLKELKDVGTISGATWTHGIGAPVAQTAVIDWNKHPFNVSTDILIPQGLTAGRDIGGSLFENVRKQAALNLDGNSWAEVHDNASIDLSDANASFEAWVYHIDTGAVSQYIMNKFDGTTGIRMRTETGNNFGFYASDGTNSMAESGIYTLTANAWNHIVLTSDGTNFKRYINGALTTNNVAGTPLTTFANADNLYIGSEQTNASLTQSRIAQPRIYNRALTASEVLRNYNSGKSTYQ